MKTKALCCLLGMLLAASAANAEVTYKSYKAAKASGGEQWNFVKMYFTGAGNAYTYANLKLLDEHVRPFFCLPPALILNPDNFIDILEQELGRRGSSPPKDDLMLDPILLFGLIHTFPCKP